MMADDFTVDLLWNWTRPDNNASGSSFIQTYDTVESVYTILG